MGVDELMRHGVAQKNSPLLNKCAKVSEKLNNFSDTGINAAISWFIEKKHEIAKAVQEVTDFLDSPQRALKCLVSLCDMTRQRWYR
jgi:hypothetical protein